MQILSNNATTALAVTLTLSALAVSAYASSVAINIDEPIVPIPEVSGLNLDKVELGKKLFNDTRLSHNNKIACASCHQLETGGDDNKAAGLSHDGSRQPINTPTIFNARYNFRQNWDGSVRTLAGQIDKVIHDELKANTNWYALIGELSLDEDLSSEFSRIYTSKLSKESYVDALNEYLLSLVTPNARFDLYLKGDETAINAEEKSGYRLFKELGCISCHQGINIGGNLYQKLGIFYDYFASRGNVTQADYGRANFSGREADKHVFKVPTLRNIENTAPYLHDGSAETLREVIEIMAKTQLGKDIDSNDVYLIEQFLKTLTGQHKDYASPEGNS